MSVAASLTAPGAISGVALRPEVAPLLMGRASGADIVLDDPTVSHVHAQLSCEGREWVLADDGRSRSGCFVNGQRVREPCPLRDGDRVRLGNAELVFRSPRRGSRARLAGCPPLHRQLLLELARPLRERPRGLPSTDTELAQRLGMTIAAARNAVRELCVWYGIAEADPWRARARLADAGLALGGR
jgi:pSer/pThr/pTyr-binding forkhead associated (FHA) protein